MINLGKTNKGDWVMWQRTDGKIDLFRRKGLEIERKCTHFTTADQVNEWLDQPPPRKPTTSNSQQLTIK